MDRRQFLSEAIVLAVGAASVAPVIAAERMPRENELIPLGGPARFRTVILQTDHINGNGRYYPREMMVKAIEDYKKKGSMLGILVGDDEISSAVIPFARVSHILTDIRLVDDLVIADIEILQTPYGKILQGLLDTDVELAMRTVGTGSAKFCKKMNACVIGDNYKLITTCWHPVYNVSHL